MQLASRQATNVDLCGACDDGAHLSDWSYRADGYRRMDVYGGRRLSDYRVVFAPPVLLLETSELNALVINFR